jgi:hypothetical protein
VRASSGAVTPSTRTQRPTGWFFTGGGSVGAATASNTRETLIGVVMDSHMDRGRMLAPAGVPLANRSHTLAVMTPKRRVPGTTGTDISEDRKGDPTRAVPGQPDLYVDDPDADAQEAGPERDDREALDDGVEEEPWTRPDTAGGQAGQRADKDGDDSNDGP